MSGRLFHSFLFLVFLTGACLLGGSGEELYVIRKARLEYRHCLRVKATTRKSEKISCLLRYIPLNYFKQDGASVRKGEVLARFDQSQIRHSEKQLELELEVADAQLQKRLMDIDNHDLTMVERMEELQDLLASQKAKLNRLMNEPKADDIRIAEGKLKIADLNLRLSQSDFKRAQNRFKRGMISRAELDSNEKTYGENKINYAFADRELALTLAPPTLPYELARTRLAVKNSELEIEKLELEIGEQELLSEIQKRGASERRKRKLDELQEKRKDLENTVLKAPISGFVSHCRINGRRLALGMRLWMNRVFMEIPDVSTIGFEGVLRESVRKHFQEGDRVIVRIHGQLDRPIVCRLDSISTLSQDLSERGEAGRNQNRKYGVNVFDVTMAFTGGDHEVHPGMTGVAELISSRPLEGPAVPLKYIRLEDGKHYLIENGVYVEVSGVVCGGWFVLDDGSWLGRQVGMRGIRKAVADASADRRLTAAGELEPVHKTDVAVGDIGWWPWPKVVHLVADETMVKKGDVIARLDPKERLEQIDRLESRLTEIRSSLEEAAKQVEITKRNGSYQEAIARNSLEIERLRLQEIMDDGLHKIGYYRALRDRDLARIRLQDTQRKLARERAKKNPTLSPVEMKRLLRNLRRNELNLERSELRLAIEREGSKEVARSRARLDLMEEEANCERTRKSAVFNNASEHRRYERIKQNLQRQERWLQRRKTQRDNHVIHAPADGLICYNKIWSDGMYRKVAVGSSVGPHFTIMSIPQLSEMEVKVEVPERYYPYLRLGMPVEVRVPSLSEALFPGQVAKVDLLFSNKGKKDGQLGLYSSREPLGEVVFNVRVRFQGKGLSLKPGLVSEVFFPFERQ